MRALLYATPTADPTRRVAALSLLRRNLLTLRRAGVTEVTLYCPDALLAQRIRELESPLADVTLWIVERASEVEERLKLILDSDSTSTETLVLSAARVHDRDLGALLTAHVDALRPLAITTDLGAPLLLASAPQIAELETLEQGGLAALRRAVSASAPLTQATSPSYFLDVEVEDDTSASTATEALWQSCRKPIDGWVSTHLNRYLSLALSRRIVDTRITPNQISVFCIILGFISLYLVLQGTYQSILWGAIAFKANSVIDGVDGELARVRWQFSPFGEALDSLGDNIANFSFFGGLATVLYQRGDQRSALLGFAGLAMWSVHLIWVYVQLMRRRRGDVLMIQSKTVRAARGLLATLFNLLATKVLRRDSFVFLSLIFAISGWYQGVMIMVLVGGGAVFGNVALHGVLSGIELIKK